jgi:GDPmannose 4,6-dehydratase
MLGPQRLTFGGRSIDWRGQGVTEEGLDAKTGRVLIEVDPRYFRPTEVDLLIGDASKAKAQLGWSATTTLSELVAEMVREDLAKMKASVGQVRSAAYHAGG